MVAFASVLLAFLSITSAHTSPTPSVVSIQPSAFRIPSALCNIPIVGKLFCPRQTSGSSTVSVQTTVGTAQGYSTVTGAYRFPVRYATANRWAEAVVATAWELPNGATTPSDLPLACPQPDMDDSAVSEDCLSMILHVPTSLLNSKSQAPVMVWIPGGSFIINSATGDGLDGSSLAIATDAIVAVIQPRLGALGFMSPSGSTNLAVRDVMASLEFLQDIVPSFGGSPSKITISGQSSGANMVRALLAVPSAASLFHSAILQSDPMDYGFLSTDTQQSLQSFFNTQLNCSSTDTACLDALSVDDIMDAQNALFGTAYTFQPSAGQFEPIRPVNDGSFITSPLDSTAPFPAVTKPILVSTVATEAGATIYGDFTSDITTSSFPDYSTVVDGTFGEPRADIVLASSFYQVSSGEDARPALQTMGTDYIWRCSAWSFSRNWIQNGGNAFVGMYVLGATYPGNDAVPFCLEPGSVCHQDDIEIVFGTVPSPTSAQSALIKEMQARYQAFLNTGNPNVVGYTNWQEATTTDVHALLLGGTGEAAVDACDPSFWGDSPQYDYQYYDI